MWLSQTVQVGLGRNAVEGWSLTLVWKFVIRLLHLLDRLDVSTVAEMRTFRWAGCLERTRK